MATKAAIGDAGEGDSEDVIELLNITVDEKVDKKLYEDMICKFYSAIHHNLYMGVKGLREQRAEGKKQGKDYSTAAGQDDIDDCYLGRDDLDKVVKGIRRDDIYQELLDLYGVKDSSEDPQLVMSKLEYLFNFKPPIDQELVVTAEIIIKTHVLMIDCIRTQFETSPDPQTLRELAKNPLESTDEKYGVPAIYSVFMKEVKAKVFEEVDQNDQ